MKDKALRRAFKMLAGSVGTSYYECENGEIGVSSRSRIHELADKLGILNITVNRLEDELSERDTVRRHKENKEPHVCKICYQEIKQK